MGLTGTEAATPEPIHPLIGEEPLMQDEQTPGMAPGEAEAPPTEEAPPAAEPPAEAAPPPAAEQKSEATSDEPPPEPKGKGFPWSDLRALRKEREAMAARLAELEAANAAKAEAEARQRQYMQPQEPTTDGGRPGIDRPYTQSEVMRLREDDPLEYNRVIAEQAAMQAQYQQAALAQLQQQNIVREQVDTFKRTHGDYEDAIAYLEERERTAWKATGLPENTPPHQPRPDGACCVEHMLGYRTSILINQAFTSRKTVPEVAYAVAQAYGWEAPSMDAAAAVAAPSTPRAPEPTPQEKIAASKAKAKAAEGSLSNISASGAGGKPLTMADVLAMDEAEMDKRDKEDPDWLDKVLP